MTNDIIAYAICVNGGTVHEKIMPERYKFHFTATAVCDALIKDWEAFNEAYDGWFGDPDGDAYDVVGVYADGSITTEV